jgi:hypothetical protein
MMQINFRQGIKNLKGEPIRVSEQDANPLTLEILSLDALNRPLAEDAQQSGVGYTLYTLSHKITKSEDGNVNLEAFEIEVIKSRIAKHNYPAFILGPAWDMLEGRDGPKD